MTARDMGLLSLPMELLAEIVYHAIQTRGLKRGFRLRLVNKIFAGMVIRVVYADRLLDKSFDATKHECSAGLMKPYLAYRMKQVTGEGPTILDCIARIAKTMAGHDRKADEGLDAFGYWVETICSSIEMTPILFGDIVRLKRNVSDNEYQLNLLAWAIRTNTLPVIESCLSKNSGLLEEGLLHHHYKLALFGYYECVIGEYATEQVLEHLLNSLPPKSKYYARDSAFKAAMHAGRVEIVQYLYRFEVEDMLWSFGDPTTLNDANHVLRSATSSLEILHLIDCLRMPYVDRGNRDLGSELYLPAQRGRHDTIVYLLELGANAGGGNNKGRSHANLPVREAARWGHVDVVQLLLENGASWEVAMAEAVECGRTEMVRTLAKMDTPSEEALSISAERGRLGIVKLLLDADVGAMSGSRSPLAAAIGLEHTAMFELLLRRGVEVTPETARACFA